VSSPAAARHPIRTAAAWAASLALVAAAVAACGIGGTTATDDVQQSLATQSLQVRVEMFNGSIDVRPGPAGTVSATVTRTGVGGDRNAALADAQLIEVTLTETDAGVVLRAIYTPEPSRPDRRGASAVVTLPPEAVLTLATSNGPVTTAGLTGTIVARTSNAPVTVTGGSAALNVQTSNGGVTVRDGAGIVDLETSNGAIDVAGTSVVLAARTSNGSITFGGSLAPGVSNLETSNARVEVTLPADASFDLDASTSNSKVTSDFGFAGGSTSSENHVAGHAGTGPGTGVTLIIRTSNAEIGIRTAR
jgi:hypothetical protein